MKTSDNLIHAPGARDSKNLKKMIIIFSLFPRYTDANLPDDLQGSGKNFRKACSETPGQREFILAVVVILCTL